MAKTNLSELSLEELKTLQANVKKTIDSFEDRRRREAAAAVEAKAKELGFTISELYGAAKKGHAPQPPKFRNPDDHTQTWSGRGRKPHWINAATASGKSIDDFLIG